MDRNSTRKSERIALSKTFDVEQKSFTISLCENDRGRFVKVTEATKNRSNSIIIPEKGVELIAAHLEELSNHCAVPGPS